MTSAEDAMFQEVLSAIEKGEKARARDLLARLLKTSPNDPTYWVHMSAVVETRRERIYCLKEALRLDPQNLDARLGLTLMGALPEGAAHMPVVHNFHRRWDVGVPQPPSEEIRSAVRIWKQVGWISAGVALLAILLVFGLMEKKDNSGYLVQNARRLTALPTLTDLPTSSPVAQEQLALGSPIPLLMRLKETYTPTPLYITTEHPRTESFRSGLKAYKVGNFSTAAPYFQQVITLEPQALDVFYFLGESYRQQQNYVSALAAFEKALELKPDFAPALTGKALAMLAKEPDRWQEAEALLVDATLADPAYPNTYFALIDLALQQSDPQTAQQRIELASSVLAPSPVLDLKLAQVAILLGQPAQAVQAAQSANQADLTMLESYQVLGQALIANNQPDQAIEPLITYLQFEPKDAQAWKWLGTAYATVGKQSDALKAFGLALKIDPDGFETLYLRGMVYLDQMDGPHAFSDLQTAFKIQPKSFTTNIALGRAYLLQEMPGNAYQQFATAEAYIKTDTDRAEMLFWRAQSLELLNELPTAINNWQHLLNLPEGAAKPVWVQMAQARLAVLITLTPTPPITTAGSQSATALSSAAVNTTPTATPRP